MKGIRKTLCSLLGATIIGLSGCTSQPDITKLVDINKDGKPDIVELRNSTMIVGIYGRLNNGNDSNGKPQFGKAYEILGLNTISSIDLNDVNSDGNIDIVYRTGGAMVPTNFILYGNGDGTFKEKNL